MILLEKAASSKNALLAKVKKLEDEKEKARISYEGQVYGFQRAVEDQNRGPEGEELNQRWGRHTTKKPPLPYPHELFSDPGSQAPLRGSSLLGAASMGKLCSFRASNFFTMRGQSRNRLMKTD